ncbi:MAG TPA: NAD(P)-dependent oxidoreductase, partial [Moraxellaceae bacterium]|nr:NAD(P)-dependent oxidoreductase [Moraxellaceae bacterium]
MRPRGAGHCPSVGRDRATIQVTRFHMDYLPIFLNLREQRCLVVGGGDVALRKATMLLRAGGQVHVVAPVIDAALR